ncbi:MAG: hypothetical protein R3D57_05490 [Hyphomicrobiaceae bacterium]
MAILPFEQACSSCHLDQILGKERASGPKGIAFLSMPGLDLETLRAKKAPIGEWPETSEAPLTPFMMVMLGRTERGRVALEIASGLNLMDLSGASESEIKAVTDLVWEIKLLYHTLITAGASAVVGKLDIGGGSTLPATSVADLTASIPRDVLLNAQQRWLPNLSAEIESPEKAGAIGGVDVSDATAEAPSVSTVPTGEPVGSGDTEETISTAGEDAGDATTSGEVSESSDQQTALGPDSETTDGELKGLLDPPPCSLSVLGQCLVFEEQKNSAEATVADGPVETSDVAGNEAESRPIVIAADSDAQPSGGASKQRDELLFPTEEELRQINEHHKNAGQAVRSESASGAGAAPNSEAPLDVEAVSVSGEASNVDPESWADYGGWYRQDYTIYYGPAGHKDRFITAWLTLTGTQAPEGSASPAAGVFDALTLKDAPGACTKCHSVDEIEGKSRLVNFAPLKATAKYARLTNFVHEPHLSTQTCVTCHVLARRLSTTSARVKAPDEGLDPAEGLRSPTATANTLDADFAAPTIGVDTGAAYLRSYDQNNPRIFVSEFANVKKEICQSCHAAGKARQDCLLCHDYHLGEVLTPLVDTTLSDQR